MLCPCVLHAGCGMLLAIFLATAPSFSALEVTWTKCPGRAFAGACRDVGNLGNVTVAECEEQCANNSSRCTAINFRDSGGGGTLRACPLGTPPNWFLQGETGYAHYPVDCAAPPSPAPAPSPPSPTPAPAPAPVPQNGTCGCQVHISLGWPAPNTYIVTWSTSASLERDGGSTVEYWYVPGDSAGAGAGDRVARRVVGAEDIFVDNGTLRHTQYVHRAAMAGLEHGRRYEYRVATVGDGGGEPRFCNETFEFVALFPSASDPTSLTVFGDMGWWNNRVFGQLAADAVSRDTDIVVHNGDMAYDLHVDNASVGDRWLNQLQPIASRQPYMVAQGNHEAIYDGLNYIKRFSMPNRTQAHNLWYSFDHGNAHCLVFTSEAYFEMLDHRWPELGRDSWGPYPDWVRAQRAFIASDLASAAARRDSGTGPRCCGALPHLRVSLG